MIRNTAILENFRKFNLAMTLIDCNVTNIWQ